MSKASEWARRHAQTEQLQPKYECVTWNAYRLTEPGVNQGRDDEKEGEVTADTVGLVHPTGRLWMPGAVIDAADARAFARWILDTFGDSSA